MSVATPFATLFRFPFCVPADPGPDPDDLDKIYFTGLSETQAMKFFWLIESVRLQCSWAGTENIGSGTPGAVSCNIDYTFFAADAPSDRVCYDDSVLAISELPSIANALNVNGGLHPANIGMRWGSVVVASPYTFRVSLQNNAPAGAVLAGNYVATLDPNYNVIDPDYTLITSTTFTIEGQTLTIYLFGFLDGAPFTNSGFSFSLTPSYFTFP